MVWEGILVPMVHGAKRIEAICGWKWEREEDFLEDCSAVNGVTKGQSKNTDGFEHKSVKL